jgi:hypothetical protein
MPKYAVIENNLVTNIIISESKEIAEMVTSKLCIEILNEAGIGWTYDGSSLISPIKEEFVVEEKVADPKVSE